jgi:predicted metal-binding membrane protein
MSARPGPSGVLTAAIHNNRAVTAAALAVVTALAWGYIVHLAGTMGPMNAVMVMPQLNPWGWSEMVGLFVMWAVMMTAMMIPSAAPVILLFAGIADRRQAQGVPAASAVPFIAGYLIAWVGYSAVAALAQSVLHTTTLLSPAMRSASPWLGGTVLIAAGVYQWLPLKQRCLLHCRSPLGFFATEWREGNRGALVMGLRHGSYCVGCCWLLMALLFVAGVMNLVWVAALTLIVLLEKVAPGAAVLSRAAGLAMLGAGSWLLLAAR